MMGAALPVLLQGSAPPATGELLLRPEMWGWGVLLLAVAGGATLARSRVLRRVREASPASPLASRRTASGTAGGVLRVGALVAAALALLGPVVGSRPLERPVRELELQVVVDVSRSMGVTEAGVSRFERGRRALARVLTSVPGARVGVSVFGSSGHTLLPATDDAEVVRLFLASLEPGALSSPGSSRAALVEALDRLPPPGPDPRVVLLVTDGEWWDGNGPLPDGPPLHVLWTGTPRQGAVEGGGVSLARTDDAARLARERGGRVTPADDGGEVEALARSLRALAVEARASGDEVEPVDGAPLLAGGAAALLLLATLVGALRRHPGRPA